MAKHGRDRAEEKRRQVLAELRASGLSVAAFARERGLSAWTIYDWRRRLREQSGGARNELDLVKVTVAAPAPAPQASTIAVELEAGHRVYVPAGFDAAELRRLLEVLASC